MKKTWSDMEEEIKKFLLGLQREIWEDKQQIIKEVREQVMQEVTEREER